jgi:hypothetical protein
MHQDRKKEFFYSTDSRQLFFFLSSAYIFPSFVTANMDGRGHQEGKKDFFIAAIVTNSFFFFLPHIFFLLSSPQIWTEGTIDCVSFLCQTIRKYISKYFLKSATSILRFSFKIFNRINHMRHVFEILRNHMNPF